MRGATLIHCREQSFITSQLRGGRWLQGNNGWVWFLKRLYLGWSILKMHKIWGGLKRYRTGILCKSCQTILSLKQIHVSLKSTDCKKIHSRGSLPEANFNYPYRIIEPTVLDCVKPLGVPPMHRVFIKNSSKRRKV